MSRDTDRKADAVLADFQAAPLQLGDVVSIGGRGHFTVVGFELEGQVVQLQDGPERFSVYAWRVRREGMAK